MPFLQPSAGPTAASAEPVPRRWWQRPWSVPLMIVIVAFVAFSLPPYLSLDPARSRIVPPEGVAFYFPSLVVHVVCGSIAILTCGFQVWPWFRQRFTAVHRLFGRIYVLAGVLPAGVTGLYVGWHSPNGSSAAASALMLSSLWLLFTIAGFRMALQRRWAEHRRWMLRSFALTMSIVVSRSLGFPTALVLQGQLDTTFGGDELLLLKAVSGVVSWIGWTLSLVAMEWWLERGTPEARRARAARRIAARAAL